MGLDSENSSLLGFVISPIPISKVTITSMKPTGNSVLNPCSNKNFFWLNDIKLLKMSQTFREFFPWQSSG